MKTLVTYTKEEEKHVISAKLIFTYLELMISDYYLNNPISCWLELIMREAKSIGTSNYQIYYMIYDISNVIRQYNEGRGSTLGLILCAETKVSDSQGYIFLEIVPSYAPIPLQAANPKYISATSIHEQYRDWRTRKGYTPHPDTRDAFLRCLAYSTILRKWQSNYNE